jgi:hypothetical protein
VRPAEKWCRRNRQVRSVETFERRELALSELVETLRGREVLEPVLAQVAKHIRLGQGGGRGREQYLATVATRGDAGGAVHVHTDVALFV